jgi:hypothetical protein
MSTVVTAPIAPRMTRHSVGTRRMTAVAGAVTAGVTALTLALLGPSVVVPPTPTVASRRYRRGARPRTAAEPGPASEIRLHQWCGTAMGEPVWILVVGDDPGLLDVGQTAWTLTSDLVIRDMLEAGAESASVRLGSWTHTHTT